MDDNKEATPPPSEPAPKETPDASLNPEGKPSASHGAGWKTVRAVNWRRWFYFPRLFSRDEKTAILVFGLIAVAAFGFLVFRIVDRLTILAPDVGGTLREGVARELRFINPLYAASDTDRDITNLVFSKLIRYSRNGSPDMDLAENIEVGEDGKVYTVHLRPGVRWHDGEDFSADDVVFTVKTIQDPDYKSPLRQNWQGVTVEKIDDAAVRLTLRQAYAPFMENLALGIIPEHLWRKIPRETAVLSDLNLKPIGTGPYQFSKLTRRQDGSIISVALTRNKNYYLDGPYIREIDFKFYPDEVQLIAAYRRNEVDSFLVTSAAGAGELQKLDAEIHQLRLPKIFAVFLNPGANPALTRQAVRQALSAAIDRETILQKSGVGSGVVVNSAIPPGTFGFNAGITPPLQDQAEAQKLLQKDGWKDLNGDGILERREGKGKSQTTEKLELRIVTSDAPELAKTAELVAAMWKNIGVKTEVTAMTVSELESSMIRPRAYEVLIFGEVFGHDPDPFAFWHTSQLKDPGLNVALYSNRAVDQLLEQARRTADPALREKKYLEFQKTVSDDIGAIFLYAPSDHYAVRKSIQGVDIGDVTLTEERFNRIAGWFVDRGRAIKKPLW